MILDFRLPSAGRVFDWDRKHMVKKSSSRSPDFRSDKRSRGRKSKIANLIWLGLFVLLFGWAGMAHAQQPVKKIPRVGFLSLTPATVQKDRIEAFREALRKLGYVEGQNINFEYRYGDNKSERMAGLAAELVGLKVDVIVTTGSGATQPAKEATTQIPIVMMADNDPVGSGFVASLARPGGNITGLTNITEDLASKRLELLKEIIPKLSRVAVFRDLTNVTEGMIEEIEASARELKLQTQTFEVAKVEDFDRQFQAIMKWRPGGLITGGGPLMNGHRKRFVEFATKNKLPAIYNGGSLSTPAGWLATPPAILI